MILLASNANADFSTFYKTRQLRQKEATNWRAGFNRLDNLIPTLSPAEERWLKTEFDDEMGRDGTYTKRALQAMDSKEYDIRVSKRHIKEIIKILSDLSGTTISDQRAEAILWAKLASLFMDHGFWQSINGLIKHEVLDKNININGITAYYRETYTLWAKYILDNIVVAYMSGNLG